MKTQQKVLSTRLHYILQNFTVEYKVVNTPKFRLVIDTKTLES